MSSSSGPGLHTAGVQYKYVHLSSTNRDQERFDDPSFCLIEIKDTLKEVSEIELVQFEIANPRNTIESGVNQEFVFSEYDADNDRYNTYLCRLPDGTFSLPTLLSVLQGAMNCPIPISHTYNPYNKYNCQYDGVGGRVRVESFTTLPANTQWNFQLHFGTGTYVAIEDIDIANDRVTFKQGDTPYEEWKPGHVLRFAPRKFRQLEVQIHSWVDEQTVQLRTGDLSVPLAATTFAQIQPVTIESKYHTSPNLTRLLGFEEIDLQGGTFVKLLSMTNPTAYNRDETSRDVTLVVETRYNVSPVTGKIYKIFGTDTFLDSIPSFTLANTQDAANYLMFTIDLINLWNTGLTASDGTVTAPTIGVTYKGTASGVMKLLLEFDPGHGLDTAAPTLALNGFVGYTGSDIDGTVVGGSWVTTEQVEVEFTFPFAPNLATATIKHINSALTPIQYVSSKYYDLTAARRVCLVAMTIQDRKIGQIQDTNKQQFFARMQLDSGPLQVQFASGNNIIGHYIEPNPIQSMTSVLLQFMTEDGHPFPFIGVDWSLCLRVKCEKL